MYSANAINDRASALHFARVLAYSLLAHLQFSHDVMLETETLPGTFYQGIVTSKKRLQTFLILYVYVHVVEVRQHTDLFSFQFLCFCFAICSVCRKTGGASYRRRQSRGFCWGGKEIDGRCIYYTVSMYLSDLGPY